MIVCDELFPQGIFIKKLKNIKEIKEKLLIIHTLAFANLLLNCNLQTEQQQKTKFCSNKTLIIC